MSHEGPMGTKGRFAAKAGEGAIDWSSAAVCQEFLNEDLKSENQIEVSQGITGDRSERSERAQAGPYNHGGPIRFHMSAGDAGQWLNWATGGTPTGSGTITYPLATMLPRFGVIVDKVTEFPGGNANFEVLDAQIDRLMIHGVRRQQRDNDAVPEPDFIELAIHLRGMSSTAGSATFPPVFALGSTEAYRPYEMSGLTINLLGDDREIKEFWFLLNNNLYQRRTHSLHPTTIYPMGFRNVMLQVRVPNDEDHKDLYDEQRDYGDGTLTIANSTFQTVVTMPQLHAPRDTAVIRGHTEIDTVLRFAARRVGTGDECTITNKAT